MIRVELPLPPSLNNAYVNKRQGGRFPSKAHRQWKQAAGLLLNVARLDRVKGRYQLAILLPQNMRGDVSNRIKLPEDLLVEHGITPDDSRCVSVAAKRSHDCPEGRCVIIVWEFAENAAE